MVRTVVQAVGGIRIVYCKPDGSYLGEVTLQGTGPDATRAMVNDLQAFIPDFLVEQARLATKMSLQRAS